VGAIKPWHILALLCAVAVVVVVAGLLIYALRQRK